MFNTAFETTVINVKKMVKGTMTFFFIVMIKMGGTGTRCQAPMFQG
jgi:hypothetical protein